MLSLFAGAAGATALMFLLSTGAVAQQQMHKEPDLSTDIKDLILKEYVAIRQEHDALDARLINIIQYMLLFSAAIYSFLLALNPQKNAELPSYAWIIWFLPALASMVGLFVLYDIANKVTDINMHIKRIENSFLYFGWEHFRAPSRLIQLISCIGTSILVLNIVAGIAGAGALNSASVIGRVAAFLSNPGSVIGGLVVALIIGFLFARGQKGRTYYVESCFPENGKPERQAFFGSFEKALDWINQCKETDPPPMIRLLARKRITDEQAKRLKDSDARLI